MSQASQLWHRLSRHAIQIENQLGVLLKNKAPRFEDVDHLIEQLRLACEATILTDFKFASEEKVEQRLWDSHIRINQRYRKLGDIYKQDDQKSKVVEQRKLQKRYIDFIKTSQFFYKGYIQRLASRFEGLAELHRIANRLQLDTKTVDQRIKVSPEVERLIEISCHGTLLRLGDLSRYRNHLRTKERSWAAALGYYGLANAFMPEYGTAHNQMAVIALADGNHLDAVYHLYRALAVNNPYSLAKGNLEIEFNKIKSLWEKKRPPPKTDSLSTLEWWFVLLHAKYYDGIDFQTHEELESEVLSRLALLLKEQSFEETLEKVILINLSAEYFAGQRIRGQSRPKVLYAIANLSAEANGASPELIRSFYFFLTLNLRMIFMLLQVLQPELEDPKSGEDLPVQSDSSTQTSSTQISSTPREKVTAVARRVLPALRQYSVWIVSQAPLIIASNEIGPVALHAKKTWNMYADVLTRLASFYPVESLRSVHYLLEEDETTVGFKPLRDSSLPVQCNIYTDDDGRLKPYVSDEGTKRHLPNEEMQARVLDIILCALILHQEPKYPIILDTETSSFLFIDEVLSIASCSSPVQAQGPTPSFEKSIQANDELGSPANTACPEVERSTRKPVPTESVAASDSHYSIDDIFMNHMVDDLLEPSGSTQNGSNETSYGMHSRTANEVFAPLGSNGYQSHQFQGTPKMLPSLPGLWLGNSAFTPLPNELQPTSPGHPSAGRQLSPTAYSSRQDRLDAAEHLEQVTGYRRSSQERLDNTNGFRPSQDPWRGQRASNPPSQEVNDILQRSLAQQFNAGPISSSDFSDPSSLYANSTPLNRQPANGIIRGPFAPNNGHNSTFYPGGSDFDRTTMLQSSIWNGSQPRQGGYTQTPPGGQGG
ncbi:Protein SMG7 [Lachnellula suecica]|uniref:Nonsense-mediated mRNA decay factor n=1 Tax=Lachnellula suecica TaxID=602035 RepID=A0A8T9CI99_9HELO|nr:Protein SMG7 [Lachnellula suecica]